MIGFNFHYFEDGEKHIACQGSLTSDQFEMVLDDISSQYKIVDPTVFMKDILLGCENEQEACLTFDCGLKSQIDIALPVLERRGLKAFWMLYTGALNNGVIKIEEYHHFRFSCYENIMIFYQAFFQTARDSAPRQFEQWLSGYRESDYLGWSSYYTEEDKLYKYIRDTCMSMEQFDRIMSDMMKEKKYDVSEHRDALWLTSQDISYLSETGHTIGLHTHTHPNAIGALSYDQQMKEYATNQQILMGITNQPIICMSHPCNSYSKETFRVLEELGIKIGFRADDSLPLTSPLLVPRIDHAAWIKKQKEQKNGSIDSCGSRSGS